jgi:hypothetical protein
MARKRANPPSGEQPPSFEQLLQTLKASFRGRLAPPLGGFVYRFTIFLPLLSQGKEVFTAAHRELLAELFHACFQGYTESSSEGHPPWYGSWAPPDTAQPVVDRHTLMVLYTPQIDEAKDFFRQLRWILEQKQVANQDVVLIEHTTAWLVEPSPLPES